ncbi:phenylalanine--tRNA ligase subunit beta [Prochlorococcus marinus]|uniref:phenylalanine--tRNA ligase subunit beta n=1 Tax=Prochlorococcus TaxID=1218 RepID=UPI0007B32D8B|nr:phenylalanine--tRNA ligase subunit beta [Prochlorococcus marinus]KZR75496.1 Phenylalanine--tRNA ligase beta subunit [Prochlorococcus marinus str. MIT 1323]
MRVSLSWLQDLVQLNETVENLAERLSMAGFEVEAIDDLASRADGVVVGLVKDHQPHPNADKLSVCQVDVGLGEGLQIVCGAPNVRLGIHVPVAMVGATLPAVGIKIKASELRGVPSQGMICSLAELGLESNGDGIAILEEIAENVPELGQPVAPLLGLDDTVLELAITANRPDGMSMVGIAREVAALTGASLQLPQLDMAPIHKSFEPDSTSSASMLKGGLYGLTALENVDGELTSPAWLKQRLERSGLKSVNGVVDITNLVMLEQGQPLHAFDIDALELITGQTVSAESFGLRQARNNEVFNGLDGHQLALNENCQIVTCHDIPIALAGVIGSAESGVSAKTRRVWLESAMFTPTAVRTTCRAVGLRTDASSRFEKGLPVEMTLASARRAVTLMEEHLGIKSNGCWVYGEPLKTADPVKLRREAIHRLLGPIADENDNRYLEDDIIETSLLALGCELSPYNEGWLVIVPPSRRRDLSREVDLIEEVSRLVGFDRFEANLPDPLEPGGLTTAQTAERLLRQMLCGAGLQEVTTLSLVGADSDEPQRISISNPLLAETSHLRTNLWEEHLRICQRNLQSSQPGCWLYEIGNVYTDTDELINQRAVLGGVICAERRFERWSTSGKIKSMTYHQARGQLSQVFQGLKLDINDRPLMDNPSLHPGRSAALFVEGKLLGDFGQLHPALSERLDLPEATYLFALDLQCIIQAATRSNRWNPTFRPFPTVPAMELDLAVIVSKECSCSDLIQAIRKAGKPLLEHVELIDRFEGGQLDPYSCSQAFRLRYRSKDRTLSEDKVNPIHDKVRQALVKQFSAELRS